MRLRRSVQADHAMMAAQDGRIELVHRFGRWSCQRVGALSGPRLGQARSSPREWLDYSTGYTLQLLRGALAEIQGTLGCSNRDATKEMFRHKARFRRAPRRQSSSQRHGLARPVATPRTCCSRARNCHCIRPTTKEIASTSEKRLHWLLEFA